MIDSTFEKTACQLLADDEICRRLKGELLQMEHPIKSMELTWEKQRREYVLEIILTGDGSTTQENPERRNVPVGRIAEGEYNALNQLVMAARRLHIRLKGEFPLLRRRLSTYRYVAQR